MLEKQQNVHFFNNMAFVSYMHCVINDVMNMHDITIATTDNARNTILLFMLLIGWQYV